MNKVAMLATLAAFLSTGCRVRVHCKNEGDCPDGYSCNHETEQCEPDPCFNHEEGFFLRCDGATLYECGPSYIERAVPCASGCNQEAERCNDCPPDTSYCAGETWTVCDASGLVVGAEPCPGGCGSSGCQTSCGNGTLDPGEACDDGNNVGGDGCSADCVSDETCGNGVIDPGEVCDDGNNYCVVRPMSA